MKATNISPLGVGGWEEKENKLYKKFQFKISAKHLLL